MEMVAIGLRKNLKIEQRKHLLNLFREVSSNAKIQRIASAALDLQQQQEVNNYSWPASMLQSIIKLAIMCLILFLPFLADWVWSFQQRWYNPSLMVSNQFTHYEFMQLYGILVRRLFIIDKLWEVAYYFKRFLFLRVHIFIFMLQYYCNIGWF